MTITIMNVWHDTIETRPMHPATKRERRRAERAFLSRHSQRSARLLERIAAAAGGAGS